MTHDYEGKFSETNSDQEAINKKLITSDYSDNFEGYIDNSSSNIS